MTQKVDQPYGTWHNYTTIWECEPPPMESWFRVLEDRWAWTSTGWVRRVQKWEAATGALDGDYTMPRGEIGVEPPPEGSE